MPEVLRNAFFNGERVRWESGGHGWPPGAGFINSIYPFDDRLIYRIERDQPAEGNRIAFLPESALTRESANAGGSDV